MLADLFPPAPVQFLMTALADRLMTNAITAYRKELRAAVRGLYEGYFDEYQFWDAMSATIRLGLTRAWERGANEMGIQYNELSQEELGRLNMCIQYEHQWIPGLMDAVIERREARRAGDESASITALFQRLEIWAGRYEGVRAEARAMAGADQKLVWDRGATKDACRSCLALANKVKRASWWHSTGILPRVHGAYYLACKGFFCLCQLLPTDAPLSRGRMPNLP